MHASHLQRTMIFSWCRSSSTLIGICFTATCSLVSSFIACITTPKAPWPSILPTRWMRAALCQLDREAIARRVMGRCEARAHVFLALGTGQTLRASCAGGAALPGSDLLLRERLGGHGGSGRVGSNDDGAWGDWPRARPPPWAKGLRVSPRPFAASL